MSHLLIGLTLDDRINRTTLLTVTTVDAFCHVDVISRSPPAPVFPLLGLDRDGEGRADGLTELASDASFFTGGVST